MAPILHRFARHAWRGVVLVVGLVLVAAGLIMIVTPGPGVAAILGGLALLSTEFAWARRLLNWFRGRFAAARAEVRRRATRRSRQPTDAPEASAADAPEPLAGPFHPGQRVQGPPPVPLRKARERGSSEVPAPRRSMEL